MDVCARLRRVNLFSVENWRVADWYVIYVQFFHDFIFFFLISAFQQFLLIMVNFICFLVLLFLGQQFRICLLSQRRYFVHQILIWGRNVTNWVFDSVRAKRTASVQFPRTPKLWLHRIQHVGFTFGGRMILLITFAKVLLFVESLLVVTWMIQQTLQWVGSSFCQWDSCWWRVLTLLNERSFWGLVFFMLHSDQELGYGVDLFRSAFESVSNLLQKVWILQDFFGLFSCVLILKT